MARLKKIGIERTDLIDREKMAFRIDWDNDRHQEIEIHGSKPSDVISALERMARILRSEQFNKEI